jgi:hypothetical protein
VNERDEMVHSPESAVPSQKTPLKHSIGERSERESGLTGCLPARKGVNRKLGSLGSLGSPGESGTPSAGLSELQRRAAEALEKRRRERGEG